MCVMLQPTINILCLYVLQQWATTADKQLFEGMLQCLREQVKVGFEEGQDELSSYSGITNSCCDDESNFNVIHWCGIVL